MNIMKLFGLTPRKSPQLVARRPICGECGARDIEAHATLSWNESIQDWQISDCPEYYGSCAACGSTEARIRWEDYQA